MLKSLALCEHRESEEAEAMSDDGFGDGKLKKNGVASCTYMSSLSLPACVVIGFPHNSGLFEKRFRFSLLADRGQDLRLFMSWDLAFLPKD